MTESSFEKLLKTEFPSAEEYRQKGAELYRIIQDVESNKYVPNPQKEQRLLELKITFAELLKARIEKAKIAESDLGKTNLEVIDPEKARKSAQAEYEGSEQTPEDDARRWGSIFYAQPLRAVDQAGEAHKLIQDRDLSRLEKSLGLKYPAKDFPEIEKLEKADEQSLISKVKSGGENTSNN